MVDDQRGAVGDERQRRAVYRRCEKVWRVLSLRLISVRPFWLGSAA